MLPNIILIDHENVSLRAVPDLNHDCVEKVLIFYGANQTKFPDEAVVVLQPLGTKVEYVKIAGSGRNALDFHIAYYLGRFAAESTKRYFHIVSKDSGFDPLITHIRATEIHIKRSDSLDELPFLQIFRARSIPEQLSVVITHLTKLHTSRPTSLKTLTSTIHSRFFGSLSDTEMQTIMDELVRQKFIDIEGNKVSYPHFT